MAPVQSADERSTTYFGSTSQCYSQIVQDIHDQSCQSSRGGEMKEIRGVRVVSKDPRDRMIQRPGINWAFGLQESWAYWTGKNPGFVARYNSKMEDFMYQKEHEDHPKLHGSAYGRYLREMPHDQLARVINKLDESPDTRQAVINIHNAKYEDYDERDVACTMYLNFHIRDGELHLISSMRSQDMYWGFPYDVQAFQWMQEVIAGFLDVDLGTFEHRMDSCHYYTEREDAVRESANELTHYPLPDVRLDVDTFSHVKQTLGSGLWFARNGGTAQHYIGRLEDLSTFYADWLRVMLIAENRRFDHDNDVDVDELADGITTTAFKSYLQSSSNS